MDHEFGTSFLEPEQRGWDWLSIQLSDNRELMLYQHAPRRRAAAIRDRAARWSTPNGKSIHLADDDFTLTPGRSTFKSKNGAVYPIEWTVSIPSQRHRAARSRRRSNDQELSLVRVDRHRVLGRNDRCDRPVRQVRPVRGSGYLEMTGYHGSLGRVLSGSVRSCGLGATGLRELADAHRRRRRGHRRAVGGAGARRSRAHRQGLRARARCRRTRRHAHRRAPIELPRGLSGEVAFDHGAQYFTVRDQRFSELAAEWERDRVIAKWTGRIVSFDGEGWEDVAEGTQPLRRHAGHERDRGCARRRARHRIRNEGRIARCSC